MPTCAHPKLIVIKRHQIKGNYALCQKKICIDLQVTYFCYHWDKLNIPKDTLFISAIVYLESIDMLFHIFFLIFAPLLTFKELDFISFYINHEI